MATEASPYSAKSPEEYLKTRVDFNDDLAELTLSKLLPYAPLFRSHRAQCPSLLFELAYRSPLFELQG